MRFRPSAFGLQPDLSKETGNGKEEEPGVFVQWQKSTMSLFIELKNIIAQEISLLNRLIARIKEEKAAILEGNPDLLLESSKSKETLALEMKVLEEARASLVDKLAKAQNVPPQNLSLSEIADLAPKEFSKAFRSMHLTMQDQLSQLEDIQRGNALLIRSSLEQIQRSISLISSAMSANPTYTGGGKITGEQKKLISREV